MAIRTVTWTISDDLRRITPNVPQPGGVQGEHEATELIFKLGNSPLSESNSGYQIYIECEDAAGGYDKTEPLQVSAGQVKFAVPLAWTQYGGMSVVRLVAEKEELVYSLEGRLVFSSRQAAGQKVDGLLRTFIQTTLNEAQRSSKNAEAWASEAGMARDTATAAATRAEGAVGQAATQAKLAAASAKQAEQHAFEVSAARTNAWVAASVAQERASEAAASAESAHTAMVNAMNAARSATGLCETAGHYSAQSALSAQAAADSAEKAEKMKSETAAFYHTAATATNAAVTAADEAAASAEIAKEAEKSVSETANAVRVKRSGGILRLDDVSPLAHDMGVSVNGAGTPSSVTVKQYKRNLFPAVYANGTQRENNGVSFTVSEDGSISAIGTATGTAQFRLVQDYILPPGTYTLSSGLVESKSGMYATITKADGSRSYIAPTSNQTFTLGSGDVITQIAVGVPSGEVVDGLVFYPLLEHGTTTGAWESPKDPEVFTPDENGILSGVTSMYPVTTLLVDAEGVSITCEYNKETNAALRDIHKRWVGKRWAAMGDSITHEGYYTTKAYPSYIAEETGIEVVNLGLGGTGYMQEYNENKPFYQRLDAIPEDADVVTIMGGLNDITSTSVIGEPTDVWVDGGNNTLCAYVNMTIDRLYERLPLVQLGIMIDPPAHNKNPMDTTSSVSKKTTEYFEKIVEICRMRGIPCLDLYHCSGLRPWDDTFESLAYSTANGGVTDGLHPNETGHSILAPRIKAFLETLIL